MRYADRLPAVMAEIADLRVGGDQVADGVLTVVEDDQFLFGIGLRQEQTDRFWHEAAAVRSGHDAGDQSHVDLGKPVALPVVPRYTPI